MPADAKGVINYGLDKIRFLAPVPAGAAVTCGFKLAGVEDKGAGRQLLRLEAAAQRRGRGQAGDRRRGARPGRRITGGEDMTKKRTETAADLAKSMTELYATALTQPGKAWRSRSPPARRC